MKVGLDDADLCSAVWWQCCHGLAHPRVTCSDGLATCLGQEVLRVALRSRCPGLCSLLRAIVHDTAVTQVLRKVSSSVWHLLFAFSRLLSQIYTRTHPQCPAHLWGNSERMCRAAWRQAHKPRQSHCGFPLSHPMTLRMQCSHKEGHWNALGEHTALVLFARLTQMHKRFQFYRS